MPKLQLAITRRFTHRLHRTPRLRCNLSSAAAAPGNNIPWFERHRSLPSYRTVYDQEAWVKHRNPLRYFIRCFDVKECHVLRNVMPTVGWVTGVAAGICVYTSALSQGLLPSWCGPITPSPFATAFVAHTTVAMSLLLVFRTTQSYARWDEARKAWGATLNRCRDSIRQAATCFSKQKSKEAYARWLVAFIHSMHRHFQPEGNLAEDLKGTLRDKELNMLLSSQHRPMKALHVLGELIMQQNLSSIHQQQMSANISHFHDQLGGCERLLRTPLPILYTRHTSRFLFLWLTVLPFALFPTCQWSTMPLVAIIAVSLLKIDEIGMQIEEPFSILPLETIAARIKTDVMSTLRDDAAVRNLVNETSAEEEEENSLPLPAPNPVPVELQFDHRAQAEPLPAACPSSSSMNGRAMPLPALVH